jgi:hypothetical protein
MTNKLPRLRIPITSGAPIESPDGDWCYADDVDGLEDERVALKKRVEELTPLARLGKVVVRALVQVSEGRITEFAMVVDLATSAGFYGLMEDGKPADAARVEL